MILDQPERRPYCEKLTVLLSQDLILRPLEEEG